MSSKKFNLTEFQKATAERIFRIFHDEKQNRVLLADEVGLGKTIVARAVIEKVQNWHLKEGVETSENKIVIDDLFKVVYICSNEVIARQNEAKLGIPRDSQTSISESRLSMQHLSIARQEADCSIEKRNSQLLPMTPSTSLDMKNGCGTVLERALMYCILKDYDYFKGDSRKIIKLGKLLNFKDIKYWDYYTDSYQKQIDKIHAVHKDRYPENLYPALTELLPQMPSYEQWENYFQPYVQVSNELYNCIVPELRRVFARLSISKLQPDLVIMDEFQRFNSLITCSEDSDLGILCHHFFNNDNPLKTKILLLSATPYKPYSTLAEVVDPDSPKHFEDFKSVFRFLYSDPNSDKNFGDFEDVWADYSNSLQELRQNDWSILIAKKNQAENELRSVLSRTERRNDRIIKTTSWETNSNSMAISEGDVLSYYNICQFIRYANEERQKVGEPPIPSIPIEYVKSSPYLLSFMRDQYKICNTLQGFIANKHNKDNVPKDETSFLNKKAINSYKPIPTNNAKLQELFNEILPEDKHTELLLWVPPSHPYYSTTDSKNRVGKVFDANKGFSKLLIFSAWEMVPRMTAAMTSYEAERLVFSKLNKLARRTVYKYLNPKESKVLKDTSKDLLTYPSKFLAKEYKPREHEGQTLSEILSSTQKSIQSKIDSLKDRYQLVANPKNNAGNILLLLKALEGDRHSEQTQRLIVPARAAEILAYMAVASPAVCALRTLRQFGKNAISDNIRFIAQRLANGITTLFNRRNAQAIIKRIFPKSKNTYYYFNVLRYCAEGNFQAMLDEYAFVCVNADTFIQNMTPQKIEGKNEQQVPYLCSSRTVVDTRESFLRKDPKRSEDQISMRANFAMGYYSSKQTDETVLRADAIRTAFNMPFRPFVLSTTSIGQEGLDFHAYCRKIMHWNLPQNPIDLEQREGRINRYMSLAIRQSLANSEYADNVGLKDFWKNLIKNVKEGKDINALCGGMVPYWILPKDFEFKYPIERIVPAYPYSKDQDKYNWIIKVLSMYRLTLGQPNQEELLRSLDNANIPEEQLKKLFFNLSPFFGKQVKKRRWRRSNRFSIFFCRSPFGRRQKKRI